MKKEFLDISQSHGKNICARVSFLTKSQAWGIIPVEYHFLGLSKVLNWYKWKLKTVAKGHVESV